MSRIDDYNHHKRHEDRQRRQDNAGIAIGIALMFAALVLYSLDDWGWIIE